MSDRLKWLGLNWQIRTQDNSRTCWLSRGLGFSELFFARAIRECDSWTRQNKQLAFVRKDNGSWLRVP